MDLGCLDICCLADSDKHVVVDSSVGESTPLEISASSFSKIGKTKMTKESGQSTTSLNKFTSQIKKSPYRKASPLNWFPRKKVASYLERKIRMLQEVDGMNSSLDETLGDANPHYSRVLREKMAAKEAAHRAMEARKAAMVEASWCRILKVARRIDTKEAESLLKIAENSAAEAFKAATALGVIMFDAPNCPRKRPKIHESSADASGSTTHTVTASFETAFEVDREVAAAVKGAFTQLATRQSFSKDEFKDLQRISQTPETGYTSNEILEFSSGCESESGLEIEKPSQKDSARSLLRLKKFKKRPSPEKLTTVKLEDMMVERLQRLHEDELSSLATIVATCGLNAALAEVENNKLHDPGSNDLSFSCRMSLSESASAKSNLECYQTGKPRGSRESELPSLDKYLVKHMTKLEKEVEKAKSLRSGSTDIETDHVDSEQSLEEKAEKPDEKASGSDLASVLVKHSSKLEKEIEEFKSQGRDYEMNMVGRKDGHNSETPFPSLDKFLVKHVSRLEKEVEETKNRRMAATYKGLGNVKLMGKENRCAVESRREGTDREGLGNILVKPIHRLERAKVEQLKSPREYANAEQNKKPSTDSTVNCESLDKVLVRHVPRLERDKMRSSLKEEFIPKAKGGETNVDSQENMQGSLEQILVKHKPRIEREKILAAALQSEQEQGQVKVTETRKEARERKLWEENMQGSLEQILVKHKPRLEREKILVAALQSEQEQGQVKVTETRKEARERKLWEENTQGSLEQILVKHKPRLEREKIVAAALQSEQEQGQVKVTETRKEVRERKLREENMQGSLEQILVKHKPRLEREKIHAAALQSEQEQGQVKVTETRKEARERKLWEENTQGSLEQILVKHKPRLEREKIVAAALQSEQEQGQVKVTETRKEARERALREENMQGSLEQILVKHKPRLEREKILAAALQSEQEQGQAKVSETRQEARERELRETWGGMSLGNSVKPHLSRLERDKAAWIKAEEEERKIALRGL